MSKATAISHKPKDNKGLLNQNTPYTFGFITRTSIHYLLCESPADHYEPTNPLFIKLHTSKFCDLIDLETAEMIYRAQNNLPSGYIQRLFEIRENQYELSLQI